MPTTRQRHLLTETAELAEAIDAAAPLYPSETRADILRHLVHLGFETITDRQARHRQMVRQHAGRHPGLFPPGYLDDLRADWPE
jgi:hypothetical protein